MLKNRQAYQDLTLLSALRCRAEEEPGRTWISIPQDNNDISQGFVDISFKQLSIAIDHATIWLNKVLDDAKNSAFAYQGPNDCTPPILAAAAARLGCQILLPFPLAPDETKRYLIQASGCNSVLYSGALEPMVRQMLNKHEQLNVKMIAVPNVVDWLNADDISSAIKLSDLFECVKDRPWLILHTSGTTGKPKLVTYTQEMMASDNLQIKAANGRNTNLTFFRDAIIHLTTSTFHFSGMLTMLAKPIFCGTIVVLGPTDRSPSSETIKTVLKYSQAKSLIVVPVWVRQLCNDPDGLALLKKLDFITFVGAPMDKGTGDSLCKHTQLSPGIGTTECGVYWTYVISEPPDWEYYSFVDGQGIEFEHVSEGLYELVFRKSKDTIWQQIFLRKPDLDVYHTADLFREHPTRSGLWLYVGRKDDMFKLSTGSKIHHTINERLIEESTLVKTAVLGGPGAPTPFLLVEPAIYPESPEAKQTLLVDIWETVSKVNQQNIGPAAIDRTMIILAQKTKPFSRNVKDSILRRETFELYAQEIHERMAARGFSWKLDQASKRQ